MHDTVNANIRFLSPYIIVCVGLLIVVFIVGLTACSTKKLNEISLMPSPDVYEEGAGGAAVVGYRTASGIFDKRPATSSRHRRDKIGSPEGFQMMTIF
jgi:hypothetical protein